MNDTWISRIIKGNFQYRELKLFCFFSLFFTFLCILISYLLYPSNANYSILTHTISYLGDYERNEKGWYFLSIAFIIISVSISRLIIYIFERVSLIYKKFASFGFISLQIGSLGILLIAIFPDANGEDFFEDLSLGQFHNIISLIAIFGMLIGLIDFGLLFIFDHYSKYRKNKNELYPEVITLPYFILLGIGGVGMLFSQIISEILKYPWPGPGIFSFSLWEWILSLIFIIIIYTLALKLPNILPEVIKRNDS